MKWKCGNNIVVEEQVLATSSSSEIYSTPYMTADSGYHKLPLFKGGLITVVSGGGGFADVEILGSVD